MDAVHAARDPDDAALWPAQLARGRQPRDALAKTITYTVSSQQEFETSLRQYLDSPPEQPEHTEAQLSFWSGTTFLVSQSSSTSNSRLASQRTLPPAPHPPDPAYDSTHHGVPDLYGTPSQAYQHDPPAAHPTDHGVLDAPATEDAVALSIADALRPTSNPKDKMRKQRAIAKCCVDIIQKADGYRYSFHNCWNSREDDSFRFSYYCNDSLLNKDRVANGKGAKLGKRATKPVYDCKGVLSIKFSATKNSLDVFYKHIPLHKTYEERAPPPRKDSKRRRMLEVNDPEASVHITNRTSNEEGEGEERAVQPKTKFKKPKTEPSRPSDTPIESFLRAQSLHSLLELIQMDQTAPSGPAAQEPPSPDSSPLRRPSLATPVMQAQHSVQQPQPQPRLQQINAPKRPRSSCDMCKAKKTKCDGARPACSTCMKKNRPCLYSKPPQPEELQQAATTNVTSGQTQGTGSNLSELDKMKKELEDAKLRIQELEAEKRVTCAPVPTSHIVSTPQSQPQPQSQAPPQTQHHASQMPHTQGQHHTTKQHAPAPSNHRQQLQQLNRRAVGSPHQMVYNLDVPSPQPRLQSTQQQLTPTQPRIAQQQIQTAATQQMQTNLQAVQAAQNYYGSHNPHAPFNTITRPQPANALPTQPSLPAQNQAAAPPNPTQARSTLQIHAAGPAHPASVNTATAYGMDRMWPSTAYYGYQNSQQQQHHQQHQQQHHHQQQQEQQQEQQQDRWAVAGGSNVFR